MGLGTVRMAVAFGYQRLVRDRVLHVRIQP